MILVGHHNCFLFFVGIKLVFSYKAHILFTKEKSRFEEFENGYIAVEDGIVKGVFYSLTELKEQSSLSCGQWEDVEVTDFGNCLLIPAMNDMHVHAPQVHNQGVAMDLELLPLSLPTSIMPSVCIAVFCIHNGFSAPCVAASSVPSTPRAHAC